MKTTDTKVTNHQVPNKLEEENPETLQANPLNTSNHQFANPLSPQSILALQGTIGNKQVQRLLKQGQLTSEKRQNGASTPQIQRGFLSSVGRGLDMWWRLSDEGKSFARSLMEHRITGFGATFTELDSPGIAEWNRFMQERPEIQRAMATKLKSLATGFASSGGSGRFSDSITDVRLNELESMRLTLHGCHRIDITGEYTVTDEGGDKVVEFDNLRFVWIDRGDLHPGTTTELGGGAGDVDDSEFTGAGWDYDIAIRFGAPSVSVWRVSGGSARHIQGWPPVTGAPAAGFRGQRTV